MFIGKSAAIILALHSFKTKRYLSKSDDRKARHVGPPECLHQIRDRIYTAFKESPLHFNRWFDVERLEENYNKEILTWSRRDYRHLHFNK